MNTRVVYTDHRGQLCVIHPAPDFKQDGEFEVQAANRLGNKDVPTGLPWRVIVAASLPASRRWRNAWEDTGASIQVSFVKAVQIRKRELEQMCEEVLAELSSMIEEAADDGDSVKELQLRTSRRNARAMQGPALDAELATVVSLEQLDSFVPDALTIPVSV